MNMCSLGCNSQAFDQTTPLYFLWIQVLFKMSFAHFAIHARLSLFSNMLAQCKLRTTLIRPLPYLIHGCQIKFILRLAGQLCLQYF